MLSRDSPAPASPQRSSTKFRHVFAQSSRREECLDWGTGRGSLIASGPKFVAVTVDGQPGGPILVGRLGDVGKHADIRKLDEHRTAVTELKWSEFNDNVLASGCNGGPVFVWHIEDSLKARVVRRLTRCSRRVESLVWHSTVDSLLLVASADPLILLWDIANDSTLYEIADVHAMCLSFSPSSSRFCAVSKSSQRVLVFDSRTGQQLKSSRLVHEEGDRVLTSGSSSGRRRELALYSLSSFSCPLCVVDVDGASGVLLPFVDLDLSLLFLTGKGDLTVRVYSINSSTPFLAYQTEVQQNQAHTSLSPLPKRVLRVMDCEIARFYRLDAQQLFIQPLSLVVPRRSDVFQTDLYPPCRSAVAALRIDEWRAGIERNPVTLQLGPSQPPHVTSKPVLLSQQTLITTDANNDRKFRFLSQVTKPDYRVISARDDFEEIAHEAEVKEQISSGLKNSLSSMECDDEEDTLPPGDDHEEEEGREGLNEHAVEKRHSHALAEGAGTSADSALGSLGGEGMTSGRGGVAGQPSEQEEREQGEKEGPESGDRRVLEEALVLLEKELRRSEATRARLERLLALQQGGEYTRECLQQDIDSLRYEIAWKDERIEWLQKELAAACPSSPSPPPPSAPGD